MDYLDLGARRVKDASMGTISKRKRIMILNGLKQGH